MRVAVTGANGRLGRALVAALAEAPDGGGPLAAAVKRYEELDDLLGRTPVAIPGLNTTITGEDLNLAGS